VGGGPKGLEPVDEKKEGLMGGKIGGTEGKQRLVPERGGGKKKGLLSG